MLSDSLILLGGNSRNIFYSGSPLKVQNHCDTWISVAAIVCLLLVQIQEDFSSQHMAETTGLLPTAIACGVLEVMGRKS